MKSMTTNMMMAAAALVIATGVASAQQYRADIPFAFNAGGRMLAAGTYEMKVSSGSHWMLTILSRDTQRSIMVVPSSRNDGREKAPAGGAPTLTFVCGSSRCSLAQMWTGPRDPALTFSQPRSGKDEQASATVRVVKMNGD